MPYNIQFQVAALVLMIMTGILLTEKMAVRLHTQKMFIILYVSVIISIVIDILSVIFITDMSIVGKTITEIISKSYLVTIVFVAFLIWQYTMTEIHQEKKNYLKPSTLLGILPLISELVVVIVTPIYCYHEGTAVYTYGFSVQITYWCCLFYLLVTLLYTFVFFKSISKYICNCIWFLVAIWIIAAVVQSFNNSILIISLAMAVAMVFMYIRLENPAAYVDNELHVYNSYAYAEYLQKLFTSRKKIWVASVRVDGIAEVNEDLGIKRGRDLLCMVVAFLKQTGHKNAIYRTGLATFAIFYQDEKELLDSVNQIENRFRDPWRNEDIYYNLQVKIAYLADSSLVNSVNEMMDVLHYFVKEGRQ